MKLFFAALKIRLIDSIRGFLGINDDVQAIAKDMNTLAATGNKIGIDVFELFHTLPFTASILSLSAADAAKFVNPTVNEQNMLLPILTAIVMQARQGNSTLQVNGTLSDTVRAQLLKRGFKVEDVDGSNENKSMFVLWT